MAWRLALSLETLQDQLNKRFPNRSKISDGTIGDASHASRSSDHNPWVKKNGTGIVTAIDITNDPANGISSEALANALLQSKDKRIKYIISNKKIASGGDGPMPWGWRAYHGSNPHNHHVHISVEDKATLYDDASDWDFEMEPPQPGAAPLKEYPVIKKGSKGDDVERLQTILNRLGSTLLVDGKFGKMTDKEVRLYQRTNGLHVDGVVGQYTWEKLENEHAV